MKKILISFILIFLLSGCMATNRILYSLYVASIGINYDADKNEYSVYFFIPSSVEVGSIEGADEKSSVAVIKGENISSAFYSLEESSTLNINLRHISSFIIHNNVFENNKINEFIEFIKKYEEIDFNFYIYATSCNISEIYKIENPNNESVVLTPLAEPLVSSYICLSANPIHYSSFVRDYYLKKTIKIPLIESINIWNNDKKSIYVKGIAIFTSDRYIAISSNESTFFYLKSNDALNFNNDNLSAEIHSYKVKITYSNNIKIKCRGNVNIFKGNIVDIENCIENIIKETIDKYYEYDPLNFKYYKVYNHNIVIDLKLNEN